jgi:DNA-binding NtrC family response regulator
MSDALQGKKILIVDDEPDILETLKELLESASIDTADSYRSACELLNQRRYDVAILDIMGVEGYKLLEVANLKGVPAVMLTAHALSPENMVRSLKEGARCYFPKDEMVHIEDHLADFFNSLQGDQQARRQWFRKLKPKFDKTFGPDWQDRDRDFWRDFESPLKVPREDLEQVLK